MLKILALLAQWLGLKSEPQPRLTLMQRYGRELPIIAGGAPVAELEAQRTALLARMSAELTTEDADAVIAEAEELTRQIEASNAAQTRVREQRARLLGARPEEMREQSQLRIEQGADGAGDEQRPTFERLAQVFTRSRELTDFRANAMHGTAVIEVPGQVRALIDGAGTSGGAFQNPSRPSDIPVAVLDRPVRLLDLIDRRPTDGSTVEYVRETTAVPGGTAAEVADGALKPESSYTFEVITDTTRTIAHWVNITRQTADDNSQLMGYIEGRLTYGLQNRLESQILNGSGVAPNLRGILNTAGIGTYVAPGGEAAVISIRKAITIAQLSEMAPDTVVLNPLDWERVELSTDSAGMFRVSPNVAGVLAPRIWGLNVVASTAITGSLPDPDGAGAGVAVVGLFLVGSFREGATLWERDGVQLFLTDSHASNFTSNILTLLLELRAALSVWRPKAFVKGSFAAGIA